MRLFKCLDSSGHGRLLLHEVHFLDALGRFASAAAAEEWEPPREDDDDERPELFLRGPELPR